MDLFEETLASEKSSESQRRSATETEVCMTFDFLLHLRQL